MCFSLWSLKDLIIWIIVICAVLLILRILFTTLLSDVLGPYGPTLIRVLHIIIACVVAVALVIVVFDLLSCLPALRHG